MLTSTTRVATFPVLVERVMTQVGPGKSRHVTSMSQQRASDDWMIRS
jgi:hypothetical protein